MHLFYSDLIFNVNELTSQIFINLSSVKDCHWFATGEQQSQCYGRCPPDSTLPVWFDEGPVGLVNCVR